MTKHDRAPNISYHRYNSNALFLFCRETELRAIASDPDCIHYYSLDDFDEFESIIESIKKSTCDGTQIFVILISRHICALSKQSLLSPNKKLNFM